MCVCVCTYLPFFVRPYKLTHVNNFLSGKYSLYKQDITLQYATAPVSFSSKVSFFSKSKSGCGDLPQTSSLAFIVSFSGVLQLKDTNGLTENAYLVVWKVGMTHIYVNENEEQPGGFAGRIIDLRKKIFLCVSCCLVQFFFKICFLSNTLTTYFTNSK